LTRDVASGSAKIAARYSLEGQDMRSRGYSHAIRAALLIACLGLSACGVKGDLEPPPGQATGQPANYVGGPAGGPPVTPASNGQQPPATAQEPEQGFFLDILL
jgi:hypothetical protein